MEPKSVLTATAMQQRVPAIWHLPEGGALRHQCFSSGTPHVHTLPLPEGGGVCQRHGPCQRVQVFFIRPAHTAAAAAALTMTCRRRRRGAFVFHQALEPHRDVL